MPTTRQATDRRRDQRVFARLHGGPLDRVNARVDAVLIRDAAIHVERPPGRYVYDRVCSTWFWEAELR